MARAIDGIPGAIVCPVFIGRQPDLSALRALIDRQQRGQGHMILVSGEAGIGKSRLLAETKAYAAAHNVALFQGNCFETDRTLPYAPLLDIFRSYFARIPPASEDSVKPLLAELSAVLPELALLFPELANGTAAPPTDPEQQKRRLFAVMTHFFTERAMRHPVLLVVEDVHWCDDLSLQFLLHLARRCQQAPLLMLVTYRSDETQLRLRQWLASLDREHLARESALERLSR
ncbi:MAG: ATP-binding protein, partial [Ktedonobacterales bacterium]